jgi:clan AA aspartic protease
MIVAAVNARYEIQVEVPLLAADGRVHVVQALIDTGFSGNLALPPAIVADLGFPFRSDERLVLANGQVDLFKVHVATLQWDGRLRRMAAQVIDSTPLVGMNLLIGYELSAHILVGGRVMISRIP